jgi:phenylacetate-CoA ligase
LEDFAQAVPPLTRSIVKERFEDLVSSEWKDKYVLGQTSGSSGTPMRFAQPTPFVMQNASRAQLAEFIGQRVGERWVRVRATNLGDGQYRRYTKERNVELFSFYEMPPEGLEELLKLIAEWRPEYLSGFVSILCILADEYEKRGYPFPNVRIIRTGAERLFDRQREKLMRVFGGEVFDHYGSEEISDYGVECKEHNGLHLFSNFRLFELDPIIDQEGPTGEVLVTDFANCAMPLIRYRNGDVLTIDRSPCPCGRSLPRATVQGRSIDILRLRDGSLLRATFFEERMVPEKVIRFLVHQRTYDRMDVHIVPNTQWTDAYRDELLEQFRAKTKIPEINFILEDEIDVEIAGKHRLLRSDISAQKS